MIDSTGKLQKVVVVGSGDKAHGLANMYECHANKGLYDLVFTEPLPKKFAPFNNHVSVAPYPDALNDADIVVLAIPSYALETFLVQNYSLLQGNCTIVDLTNASRDKKDLKETLKILGIDHDHWAKAFNDTGALQELQHRSTSKAKLSTNVCGPNEESVEKIVEFARALGYEATNAPYDQYDKLRLNQNTIGWEWVHATICMLIVFVLVFIYVTVQVSGRKNFEWYTLMCRYTNKMFAWTCVYGFAFSLLPGTMIRLIHVFSSTPASKFLIWGCNIRKHVGLISLYFLFLHLCMAVLLFGGEYFGFLLREGHMEWNDEASMLTAVLSTSLFIITGIASLPSVNQAMNKAQFALLFGPVVWGALALGLMHIMFLGVPSWTEKPRSPYTWTRGMPPVTLMASVFPLFVMFIKVTQIVLTRAVTLKKMLSVSQKSVHSSDTDLLGQKNVVRFR